MNKKELSLGEKLLFLLIPPHCAACNEAGFERLCPPCREELRAAFAPRRVLCPGGNGFADEVIALFPYEGEVLKSLLYQWKRRDLPVLGEIFLPYLVRKKLASLAEGYRQGDLRAPSRERSAYVCHGSGGVSGAAFCRAPRAFL